jgi:FkbM family methyltransferase
MLVIYPFSVPDQELALKNARWIAELGSCAKHDIFILSDRRCDIPTVQGIVDTLKPLFKIVQHRWTQSDIDGWPEGANHMFCYATALIQHTKEWPCFMWMEPDAIPIKAGWMDQLEEEYRRAGKPFMGEKVDLGTKRPDVPIHMSGVGIYQNPIYLLAGEAYRAHEVAWDIAAKDQILPHCHFTKLIQHYWKHGTFQNLEGLRPETVVFHSSKDGSLIDLLRKKAAPDIIADANTVPAVPTSGTVEPSREEIGTRAAQPPKVKILPLNGIWVLEGDTIISDEVERYNRIDFDPLLPHILPLIRPGDTVVDAGAFIGDHTVAYSESVGKTGKVIAYEPNPLAFQCLVHNTDKRGNVFTFCHALGAVREVVDLTDLPNAGSNYIGEGGRHVHVRPLDEDASLFGQIDLMKIDVEGYELNVLKGAEQLINKFHPKMVIEINEGALQRQHVTPQDVVNWVCAHGYSVSVLHQHKDAPFYDIVALPTKPPENSQAAPAHDSAAPAPVALPTVKEEIEWHILVLKQLCESAPKTKALVMQKLVYAGLRLPNKKTKHATKTNKPANGQRRPTAEECQT